MCGISAILKPPGLGPGDWSDLARMQRVQAHRGPDGDGVLLVADDLRSCRMSNTPRRPPDGARWVAAFAACRLGILDRRADADPPLAAADGGSWVLLNGEIYNFRELRGELASLGHRFRTQGDAEVALAAFERWGPACLDRFNGMWALLVVDLRRGVLFGSRDRLGVKPLFHALEGDRLLLASEPKAIAAVQRDGPRIGAYRFGEFLGGLPPQSAELSFFDEVHPVPAGCHFELELRAPATRAPVFRRYWDLALVTASQAPQRSVEDAAAELLELLASAVSLQLGADVPVGNLLSGGLDSSLLVRLAASSSDAPVRTFSLVYDDPDMDESSCARAVIGQGNVSGRLETFTPLQAWSLADPVVQAQGEPLLGWDTLAQYRAYELAAEEGRRVILDGQGGDELLGGYPMHEGIALRERLLHGDVGGLWRDLHAVARFSGRSPASVLWSDVLGPPLRRLRAALPTAGGGHAWLQARGLPAAQRNAGRADERGRDGSAVNRFLYRQTRHTNLPAVLLHQDRSSMAHGVESRVPFLDHRVVEWCFRQPAQLKLGAGERKRVLRQAARRLLPRQVVERRDKKAFVSTTSWLPLRGHAEALRDMARARSWRELPWVRAERVPAFVDGYLDGAHDETLAVWRLYTAWRWLETFRPGLPRAT